MRNVVGLIRFWIMGLLFAWCVSASAPRQALQRVTEYTITGLGTPPVPAHVHVTGLNDAGQVVGYTYRASLDSFSGITFGFVWEKGRMFPTRSLGGKYTRPMAINNRGDVVGRSDHVWRFGYGVGQRTRRALPVIWMADAWLEDTADAVPLSLSAHNGMARCINARGDIGGGLDTAVVWKAGKMRPVRINPQQDSAATAINNRGDVIGALFSDYAPPTDSFLYRGGKLVSLPTLGGKSSFYLGLNNRGEIVGWSQAADGHNKPCVWQEKKVTALETLGGSYGGATAINEEGTIVGDARDSHEKSRPCVWRNGKAADLNELIPSDSGWELTTVTAINNHGQIAGVGKHHGEEEAFLLTPTSAP